MAITEMSPSHEDAVNSLFECSNDKQRIDPAGTHDPYGPDIGWVLQPGNTGQIGPGIGTPVAKESNDFRFKIRHNFYLSPALA
jgi:hypothetical protein